MIRTFFTTAALTIALGIGGAQAADAGQTGQFTGASNHVTTGGVEIVKDGDGYIVKLGPAFFLDGAPDPKVGFGTNGKYVEGTLLGALLSNTGAQSFRVPAGLDIGGFTDVFIWCEQFSVPLGVAALR